MAIDFNTGLRALQTYGEEATREQQMVLDRQRAQIAQQRAAQEQYAFNRTQQQDQARVTLAQQARGGDYVGAQREAALGGDFDFARALGGLREDQLGQFQREIDTIGTLHPQLKALPPEQRAAVAAPILAQAGFTPEEIANNDWSDAGLDAQYELSARGKAALAARMKAAEPYTLAPGSRRYSGDEMLAENPAVEKPIWDAESGSLIYPSAYQGGQAAQAPQAPAMGAGGPLSAMMAITAQSESGNRDYGRDGRLITSPAGAQGAMQTMPGTQRDPGFGVTPARDGSVGEKNRVGRDYLRAMVQRYDGDTAKAWAAYNAGPGRVDQAVARRGENWLAAMPGETRAYVAKNTRQLSANGQPGVVQVRPPRQRQQAAPSGYRYNGDRLEPIPGGPADRTGRSNSPETRKTEGSLRKEFDSLAEVKTFKKARTQFQALRSLALNPKATAQDDIAVIFSFMKSLDAESTVREGEFATAQNAGGVSDTVRNAYNKALSGERLNPTQRKNMVRAAYQSYKAYRDAYNQTAESYRGYARDASANPDRVARTYTPDKPQPKVNRMSQFKIVRVN